MTILTVGIGSGVGKSGERFAKELKDVASSEDKSFLIDDFNALLEITNDLAELICTGGTGSSG